MLDLNKEREAFERFHAKECNCSYEDLKRQLDRQEALTGHRYLPTSPRHEAWLIWDAAWQEKAKAQAVQQSFEIGRLQDRITELLDERQDLYAQINNDQAVPETQQKLTNTYYWEGSDYVVDCPFEYDIELDKGEVLELQKWQRTESTKVYFANIYKDEDNFDILQFASKVEAENAVAENLKFLEASESGAEG
ncbi:hypothetical protein [Acinetobacter baumannii]|uniref:hypothetical protein n=1 Tax=Acinetobacter calcoaceticus/baumannii complex TaxID=909768 RepID=UPI00039B41CF|nr:hypothetical protein [Acinetobacter baumannii]AWO18391.1 hypothetical protein DLD53_19300 [Acinetobacter baumannii]EHU1267852.1 hypothetical protein [Acinetobacter baumannii]MCY2897912.1 hypothetical protein [Acinetobacter baumannii]OLV52917.1 hypothetical protein BS576_04025 [Acinetobacter baumannii]OLV73997.1 hypothetical protein BS582_10185 [Acinetobacter baumannii]